MPIHSTGLFDWEGALVVKPKIAWKMLGVSNTRGYELIKAKELDSFLDGRSRKITVESIRNYIARRIDASESPKPNQKHQPRSRWRRGAPAAATTE